MKFKETLTGIALTGALVLGVGCENSSNGEGKTDTDYIKPIRVTTFVENVNPDPSDVLLCGNNVYAVYDGVNNAVYIHLGIGPWELARVITNVSDDKWEGSLKDKLKREMPDYCNEEEAE